MQVFFKFLYCIAIILPSYSMLKIEYDPMQPVEFLSNMLCNMQTKKYIHDHIDLFATAALEYGWEDIQKRLISTIMKECLEDHFQKENFTKLLDEQHDFYQDPIFYSFQSRLKFEKTSFDILEIFNEEEDYLYHLFRSVDQAVRAFSFLPK